MLAVGRPHEGDFNVFLKVKFENHGRTRRGAAVTGVWNTAGRTLRVLRKGRGVSSPAKAPSGPILLSLVKVAGYVRPRDGLEGGA